MESLEQIGIKAKKASRYLAKLGIDEKNKALEAVADALTANAESIIAANEKDLVNAKANGMKPALIDRLTLDVKRINAMADGIRVLTGLEDPVGEVTGMKKRPNGLVIGTKRVPLGVVAIIYESRPNVTADAFGLTFKSGNACILRGGSDSINSNIAIADVIANALSDNGINPDVINLIKDTDRALVNQLMKMNDYIDVIIPRGGAGLIKNVVKLVQGTVMYMLMNMLILIWLSKLYIMPRLQELEYVMRVNHWLFTKLLQSRQFHLL